MAHRLSVHWLLASLCGLTAGLTSSQALAQGPNSRSEEEREADKYLDLEPPETLSGYGYGYNSVARQHTLKQCVTFGTGRIDVGGPSGDTLQFNSVKSNDELADDMDLSVSAKFAMSMGVASTSASTKVKFLQGTKTSFFTHTILASYSSVEPMKYIAGSIVLKPEYKAMLGTPAFRAACGDYVVIGMQGGRWLYGTVQLVAKDTTTQSRLAAGGAVDVESGTMSSGGGVNTVNAMKSASNSNDLTIRVSTSGSQTNPVNIDQFIAFVQAFPKQNGAKQTYKLKAVPYEGVVDDWPPSNPLAPLTDLIKLNTLAEAAWGLIALAEDTNFVTQNAGVFALGTTPAKRTARANFIKARRGFYLSQLDALRSGAKNCDVDWKSSPACEQLYTQWKDWENFAIAEYEQLPRRYTSDCATPREVTLAGTDLAMTLNTHLNKAIGAFQNIKGDREIDGGPTAVRAFLDFKPNFTGGDPLATRKLLATLDMQIQEKGGDQSTFVYAPRIDVADLAQPIPNGGSMVTLNQCAFTGTGVRAAQVSPNTTACDGLKQLGFPQLADQCKASLAGAKHHGILFATAAKGARTETFTKGVSGAIRSLKCTVDSDLKDDTKSIACPEIGVGSVQFDLVNSQDVLADKWVSPPLTVNPALVKNLPKGVQPSASYTATVRKSIDTSKKPLSTQTKVLRAPACKAGLVAYRGECVRPLKR